MDMQKIGGFLQSLRKERGITQEQLGEKLGVSNKTVSRWETGNYLPPVEMLQALSDMYGITINEILSARRLEPVEYQQKAEENIKSVLDHSAFTLKEKIEFYDKKWYKDHMVENIVGVVLGIVLIFVLAALIEDIGGIIGFAVVIVLTLRRRNEKMAYIEARAFDGTGEQ